MKHSIEHCTGHRPLPTVKTLSAALALAAMAALPAHASDAGGEFHGYFRAGAGSSAGHGPQACYGLGGNAQKYRLGNECDAYFEGGYTKELAKSDNGVSFVGTVWGVANTPNSDFAGAWPIRRIRISPAARWNWRKRTSRRKGWIS
jgi:maltoporin